MIKTLLFNLFSSSKNLFTLNVKLMCLGMFFVVNLGFAQTKTWRGGSGTTTATKIDWFRAGNWVENSIPTAADDVTIPSAGVSSMPSIGNSATARAKTLTINSSATLKLSSTGSLLNISGDFTNNGTLDVTTGAGSIVTIDGNTSSEIKGSTNTTFSNLVINKTAASTTVSNSADAFIISGSLTITRGNLIITATDTDYNIANDLNVAGAGTLTHNVDWSSGMRINVNGNIAIDGLYTYSVLRTVVNMNGGGKTIRSGPSPSAFSILTLAHPAGTTIQASGLVTVNDNFWAPWNVNGGAFETNGYTVYAKSGINVAGGIVRINGGLLEVTGQLNVGNATTAGIVQLSSGTLKVNDVNVGGGTTATIGTFTHSGGTANIGNLTIDGTGANAYNCTNSPTINITGNWINNKTFTPATSTVNFIGTGAQTISGSSTTPFSTLTVNKTSGILSLTSSNQTIGSNLTITAGTLDLSTFTLNRVTSGGTLNIANGATLRVGDTNNYPTNFNTNTLGASSTVEYYALANQTVSRVGYGNLVLSGGGVKTFSNLLTAITGNLNINSGVVANLSTTAVTHTAGTLTLGGMSTPAGTWGSTISNPANIDDTYFAATVGKVNVGASCTSPTVYTMTGVTNRTYCSTEAGSTIGLSSSDNGVSYQLKKGSVIVATVANGTGSPISFGVYNSTGNYTVVATRVGTLCTANMSGSINIYRTSSPPVPEATPINASCPGVADGKINVTNAFAPASLAFDSAKNQYVDFGTPLLSDKTAFTVEGWIKFDPTKYVDRMSLFGQNDVVEVAFEDGGIKCWTKYGFVVAPLALIPAGYDWHHIAATGDATTLIIYIDGVEAKRLTVGASANYGNSVYSAKIGYGIMDAAGIGLTGEVFKLGFWNRALPIAEIKALSSGFVQYDASLSGLLTGYSFNETTGSTTIAGVGSVAPTGTLTASPTSNPKPVWTDPYTYSWTSNPPGFTSSSKNIANLTNGTYILTTSLKGCSNAGSWTVNANNLATTITDQPSSAAICAGSNTSFGVTATGTNLGYKWQVSTNGGGAFNDVPNAAPYSNVTSATLNITAAGTTLNNYQYRCVVSGTCLPAVNSSAVTLTVNPTTVGGTIASSSPTNSFCTAANSATLTLSGQTGTILRWESSTDNLFTPPTPISNTTTTLPISNILTTTYYRAVVKSGACNTVNSSVIKIITGKPTANAATTPNCAGFTANWNKVDGATTYLISISKDNFTTILSAYNGKDVQGDVNLYSVTGLAPDTNYQYQIHAVLPCGTYATGSNIISVTTSQLPIAGTFTGGASAICIGEKTTFENGTPGGTWSITNGTGSASITSAGVVTGATQGQVNVVYTVSNGTCSNSLSRSLTINPPFTAPTVGTVTPISCTAATGSIALSGLPTGSWTITQSGFVSTTIGGAGTTRIISGLAKGSYSFTVTEGNCTSGSTASIEIKDESETIWNGTTWSNGNPTKDKKVTITSVSPNQPFVGDPDPKVYKDIYACSLTINSSSSEVIVPGNVTLVVTNAVITTGNLRFKNNSSLVQVSNSAVNSGNIVYERSTTPILRKDYVYWSTPVSPQTLGALSPASSKFYSNDGTQWVVAAKTDNMLVGSGYIIRAPDNYSYSTRQIYPAIFTGVPNTGDIEGESLLVDRSYVIGNPYPSAISADMLLDQNKMLDGTIYFWTHNTPQNIEAVNQYSSDDYAVYNSSGGVSASAKSDPLHNDDPSLDKGNKPTGKIAAGQGFYVSTILSGKVKFNNLMRLGAADNTQFFKPGAAGAIEKNRVWLNMTNANGIFKQLLVSYIEGATNDYDNRYDGLTFNANPYLDFYSVGNDINYVIQGRALPFVDTDIVPLGYETTIKGDFTISIDEVDGKMSNQAIYLEDKKTGEIHDLRASDYTFKTEIGTFTDRLVLRYTGRTLGTGDFENLENGILVSVKNKVINVLSSKENIKEVTVFDVSGKLLYNKKKVGNTELQISNLPAGDQVLLVKVTLENNFTTTKKVVF